MSFFEEIKKYLREFNTEGISILKIIGNRYFKYKRNGKWHKAKITNFDGYEKPAYRILESLAKKIFEEVERVPEEVPIICFERNFLYHFPRFFNKREFYFKDKVLVAKRPNPVFLKRYPRLNIEVFLLKAFHLGHGDMYIIYTKSGLDADKFARDIGWLFNYSFRNKLSEEEMLRVFIDFYSDLFPKVLIAPKVEVKPQILQTPQPKLEEKVEIKEPEQKKLKNVEIMIPKPEKPELKIESKEIEEELIPIEKIKELPYEEVKKVIREYNPQPSEFFGKRAKVEYEKASSFVKDEEKKIEIDYLFCQFILCSEKTKKQQELSRKFCEEIKKYLPFKSF